MHVIRKWWQRRRLFARLRRVRQRYYQLLHLQSQLLDELHEASNELMYFRTRKYQYAARLHHQSNKVVMLAHEAQALKDEVELHRRHEVRLYLKLANL